MAEFIVPNDMDTKLVAAVYGIVGRKDVVHGSRTKRQYDITYALLDLTEESLEVTCQTLLLGVTGTPPRVVCVNKRTHREVAFPWLRVITLAETDGTVLWARSPEDERHYQAKKIGQALGGSASAAKPVTDDIPF